METGMEEKSVERWVGGRYCAGEARVRRKGTEATDSETQRRKESVEANQQHRQAPCECDKTGGVGEDPEEECLRMSLQRSLLFPRFPRLSGHPRKATVTRQEG